VRPISIGDYAVIGDCRSAALVSRHGAIDWLCWPHFDSPSLFAALLDPDGGTFSIAPVEPARSRRRYLPGTCVVETVFETSGGSVEILDCMPLHEERGLVPQHELVRWVRGLTGELALAVRFEPRPAWGRRATLTQDAAGLRMPLGHNLVILSTPCASWRVHDGGATTTIRLRAGETCAFSLGLNEEAPAVIPCVRTHVPITIERTIAWWRRWITPIQYDGPYRDAVERSALTLKLMTFSPSGAIVAAPTTSLPEAPAGGLNWDYRYCWLRDASFTARALFGLGFQREADPFLSWLLYTTRLTRPRLRAFYDVFGRRPPRERELPFRGFRAAAPVRTGNGARDQLQLDVYGEVIDAALRIAHIDRSTRRMLVGFGEEVCARWREPDQGIWETRGPARPHTHSRVLAWTALDRLTQLGLDDRGRFEREAAAIKAEIEARAWNPTLGTYTATLDGDTVDAALLTLPFYGFTDASHPRMRATIRAIERELGAGRGLLYREPRSRDEREGAFAICSFWWAGALAHGGGTLAEGRRVFEDALGYANDVGLFAEEIDPQTGDPLGNFPQAYTHIGLVNAALTIEGVPR
jgi:GH15 family glucan-1,4-alpha-glucosidase